jgi:hypothetical protein
MTGEVGAHGPFPDARVLLDRYQLRAKKGLGRAGLDLDAVPSASLPRRG